MGGVLRRLTLKQEAPFVSQDFDSKLLEQRFRIDYARIAADVAGGKGGANPA